MLSLVLQHVLLWLTVPVHVLVLTDVPSNAIPFHHAIYPGDTFTSVYTHSLELTPVWEYFRIGDEYEIVLTDTLYESTGAGLPIPLYGQDKFTKDGSQFHIFDINRRLPPIYLRVNVKYNNVFLFNEQTRLNLSESVGNSVVRIETRRESLGAFYVNEFYEQAFSLGW